MIRENFLTIFIEITQKKERVILRNEKMPGIKLAMMSVWKMEMMKLRICSSMKLTLNRRLKLYSRPIPFGSGPLNAFMLTTTHVRTIQYIAY